MLIDPEQVPERTTSIYPAAFRDRVAGRVKQSLGNAAKLTNFGVNLVKLAPGSRSALRHWHSQQDEFIYVLQGQVTLVTNAGEQTLTPGMAAGFPAGEADGHCLINRSEGLVVYLEVGDRTPGDQVYYPDDDLVAQLTDPAIGWVFSHRDGTPYETNPA